MQYLLYTLVDISNSGKYHHVLSNTEKLKEQNFNTVLQTIGLRSNISSYIPPAQIEIKGSLIGFKTDEIIRVWRFDFETERDGVFDKDNDPVGTLKDDFNLVPYIPGLDELMEQKYSVFSTFGDGKNIVFRITN
jgi:hypothetical protein